MSQKEERWIEFEACRIIDDDDKVPNFDIFGDPDPYETFDFNFQVKSNQEDKSSTSGDDEKMIKITLKGFKHEHERIFDSIVASTRACPRVSRQPPRNMLASPTSSAVSRSSSSSVSTKALSAGFNVMLSGASLSARCVSA